MKGPTLFFLVILVFLAAGFIGAGDSGPEIKQHKVFKEDDKVVKGDSNNRSPTSQVDLSFC